MFEKVCENKKLDCRPRKLLTPPRGAFMGGVQKGAHGVCKKLHRWQILAYAPEPLKEPRRADPEGRGLFRCRDHPPFPQALGAIPNPAGGMFFAADQTAKERESTHRGPRVGREGVWCEIILNPSDKPVPTPRGLPEPPLLSRKSLSDSGHFSMPEESAPRPPPRQRDGAAEALGGNASPHPPAVLPPGRSIRRIGQGDPERLGRRPDRRNRERT